MAKTFKELKTGDTLWMVSYVKCIPDLIELTVWCNSKMLSGYSEFCKFYYKYPDKKSKYSMMARETEDSVYQNNGTLLITINREKAIEKQKECARIQLKKYLEHVEIIQDRIEKLLMILEED